MDAIWKTIRQDVENKNWDNTLEDLFKKSLNVVLYKYPVTLDADGTYSTISKNGDIVVGFYNTSTTTKALQITIGGTSISDLIIATGDFAYMFENTHPFPIIAMEFSLTKIKSENCENCEGLYVVYAAINDGQIRRDLASSANIMYFRSGLKAVIRGHFRYVSGDIKSYFDENLYWLDKYIDIPDMGLPLQRKKRAYADLNDEVPIKRRKHVM